jgi:hypothetical protein
MKFAYAIAGAAVLAGAASAQQANIVRSVSVNDLETFVTSEGHQVLGFGEAGDISVRAETPDGLVYFMSGTACEAGQCRGINISSRFEANETVTLEKINQANIERAATSVWLLDGTSLGVSRYVILDGGMTRANIETNLENFLSIVPGVIQAIYPE